MEIHRHRLSNSITVSQNKYVIDLLTRFNMLNCAPVATPIAPGEKLTRSMSPSTDLEREQMATLPYRRLVGGLLYLSVCTRPDISTAVNSVARFMADPGELHWRAAKRILRYLSGTRDLRITFSSRVKVPLLTVTAYSDADWGGNLDTRRSTTGYVFFIFNGPVSWSSRTQPTVALSTAEAEYMAVSAAVQEAIWLRNLLSELGFQQKLPTTIFEDNQGCIKMAENPVINPRSKHIDLRHHYIRERVADGSVALAYCPTAEMVADLLTKGLAHEAFTYLRNKLMGDV
jgi:hypothetical protein